MAHQSTANVYLRELLEEIFPTHVIASEENNDWPARLPDLTACNFFLWGYLKSKVFASPLVSIDVLRRRIQEEFEQLRNNQDLVCKAVRDMACRAALCIEREGGNVEGMI